MSVLYAIFGHPRVLMAIRLGIDFPKWYAISLELFRVAADRRIAVGWIATIRVLGDIFDLEGFFVWHLIMAIAMCTVWIVLFTLTAVAFWKGKIFLAKDEDVVQDMKAKEEYLDEERYNEKRVSGDSSLHV